MGFLDDDSVLGYDYNHDGKINSMDDIMYWEDMDDEDRLRRESEEGELEDSGLDCDELEDMDEDERREALENAGLDPDDFDF